ncbi:hypothetical protein Tsubulata_025478, partial [Turnera subulata]
MAQLRPCILVALFILLISTEAIFVQAAPDEGKGKGNDGNGKGNNGNGKGSPAKGDEGKGKGNNGNPGDKKGKAKDDNGKKKDNKSKGKDPEEDFDDLPSYNGQEQAKCKGKGKCYGKTIVCPAQCPEKKPKKNKKGKACHVNCGHCEATCKKPNCNGYGALCYDPRFVGGDGVMFYFHGAKGGNFAIVSDDNLHINAHFIGTRPQGRTRDYTWVQALAVMFDTHNLVLAAKRVSHWDDSVDALTVRFDGEEINIPADEDAEWKIHTAEGRKVVVERTDDTNNVRVTISGLLEMDIKVRPIGKEENRVHNYQLPEDDAFAHLETQFKFKNLSDLVEGVLGKTYRENYVSPVKFGVPMPMMGGEDKYQTPSLLSPLCKECRFQKAMHSGDNLLCIHFAGSLLGSRPKVPRSKQEKLRSCCTTLHIVESIIYRERASTLRSEREMPGEDTCVRPNCNGYGSLCYDPRFVGGDGVMFYFHGEKGGNFAIVSDDNLQINAHFIGTRPQGRTRDYTWVKALSVMFDTHTLVIAAKIITHWDDSIDALVVRWDGETVEIPTAGEAEWRANEDQREVVVERTDDTNTVRVTVSQLVELDIKVRPIGKEEDRVHNYQLPKDDAFAHLEMQFKFFNLTDLVEGVLGKTYQPDYVSPVKVGVPMPMMGGEDKYQTPSLFSPVCRAC